MTPAPTILLDVMNTLVYDPFHVEVPAFFGMSFEQLVKAKHPTAWLEYERGERDEDSFLDDFFRDGRDFDREGLIATMRNGYRWLEGMESLVSDLRSAGHELHLFSNYSDWYHHVEDTCRLSRHARWTYVSCDHGPRKPETEAFELAAELAGAPPADCLLIDDNERNVVAARRLGLAAILFEGPETLRAELEKLDVL